MTKLATQKGVLPSGAGGMWVLPMNWSTCCELLQAASAGPSVFNETLSLCEYLLSAARESF